MKNMIVLLGIVGLAGCTAEIDSVSSASREEVLANPEAYLDLPLTITGEPDLEIWGTAALCEGSNAPCNNLSGPYVYGSTYEDGGVMIVPSETWSLAAAVGEQPLPCYDEHCDGVAIGCHGNELEVVCAPAVPARILAFHGVLSRVDGRLVFTADDVERAGAPFEQDFAGPSFSPHMTE